MIGIQLKGRLGNQMFQYASARSLAERLDCGLVLSAHTLGRRFGLTGHWLGLDEDMLHRDKQQNGLLHNAFGLRPMFGEGRLMELSIPWLRRILFPHEFSPCRLSPDGQHSYEEFDLAFFEQTSGTWLSGWFQ